MSNPRYETVHTVETEVDNIVVRVILDKLARDIRSMYRFEVGEDITIKDRETGKEITIYPARVMVKCSDHNGRATLDRRPGMSIMYAINEVEEWILRRLDEGAEERLERKRLYEEKQASFGKPKTRHTGKTEKNRNKKKGIPATT